ncbi:MAG: AAA family ATPase [Pseudomonadota bacterium]
MNDASHDFATLAPEVAREILGDPNPAFSGRNEWRYGSRGSLSIDLDAGRWFDHEANEGGGVLDLLRRERGLERREALEWLRERGHLPDRPACASGARSQGGRGRIAATYAYRDERGELLFEVVRFDPKDFRQRAPDGAGGWRWSLKGVRRVPYRLPEIMAAPPASPVFLVEGEKDADALAAEGLVATTCPQGAGKWRDDYAEALQGREVVILPDNDDAGRKHARAARASLRRAGVAAAVVELEDLPPKGDVCDWLAAGGDPAELVMRAHDALERAEEQPEDEPEGESDPPQRPAFELIRADALEFREPEYAVAGLMEAGSLAQFFGDPGCCKSFVALDLSCCIATGREFHGRETKPGAVIYLAGEGQNGIRRRLSAWERETGQTLEGAPLYVSRVAAQFLDANSAEAVAQAVDGIAAEVGPVVLIVIDTLARNFGPGDENATAEMGAFIATVDALKDRHGAGALIVHHTGHADKQRSRGSIALHGALDHEYRVEKDGEAVVVTCTKAKDSAEPDPMGFTLKSVDLGTDSKGEPITSAALVPCEAPKAGRKPLSAALQRGLDSFHKAKERAGLTADLGASVHVEDWRPAFYEMSTADTTDSKKKAFQRIRTELVARGELIVADDRYRLGRFREEHHED